MHAGMLQAGVAVNLTIAANTDNYNAFTAAGSPSTACFVTATINAGVIVGTASGTGVAFDTGAWPAGSTFLLINNGEIRGFGGNGDGHNGGDAIKLQLSASIDNTNGYIRAGGGGGAQGTTDSGVGGGGGGGGGQGAPQGTAGAKASGASTPGADGSAATLTAAGAGGAGGTSGVYQGGKGGAGGKWGANGNNAGLDGSGGRGTSIGVAGNAVRLNGNTVTWLGGNNSTQVATKVA